MQIIYYKVPIMGQTIHESIRYKEENDNKRSKLVQEFEKILSIEIAYLTTRALALDVKGETLVEIQ